MQTLMRACATKEATQLELSAIWSVLYVLSRDEKLSFIIFAVICQTV